jgi:hypothetical protein
MIPRMPGDALEAGQQDGYRVNADASIDIFTRHATYFGLLEDIATPRAPTLLAQLDGDTLRLTWHGATDNVRVSGYQLVVDGSTKRLTVRTLQNLTALAGRYQVVAVDAAGNVSKRSLAMTISAKTRPTSLPRLIPSWARPLLAWQHAPARRASSRPRSAPLRTPAWYPAWASWQTQPLRITT